MTPVHPLFQAARFGSLLGGICLLLWQGSAAQAQSQSRSISIAQPIPLSFWHAMSGASASVEQYAKAFNRQQSGYRVSVRSFDNYAQLLDTWQKTPPDKAPTLVQLEMSQYPALAAQGKLTDLGSRVARLPDKWVADLEPNVWKVGVWDGKRFALPWNVSVPALLYNAGLVQQAPRTWAELEQSAKTLRTANRTPVVIVPDTWTFEAQVVSRGGALARGNSPRLNSPEALQALSSLRRMVADGSGALRRLDEAPRSAFDFATGKHVYVMASVANWTDARKLPFFSLGIAPFPCQQAGCPVTLGGGVIAVGRSATPAQADGALAFWQFLLLPELQADWVQRTAYVPVRQAALPRLKEWYAKHPQIGAVHAQLERAQPRPQVAGYAEWMQILSGELQNALSGKVSPETALQNATLKAK